MAILVYPLRKNKMVWLFTVYYKNRRVDKMRSKVDFSEKYFDECVLKEKDGFSVNL